MVLGALVQSLRFFLRHLGWANGRSDGTTGLLLHQLSHMMRSLGQGVNAVGKICWCTEAPNCAEPSHTEGVAVKGPVQDVCPMWGSRNQTPTESMQALPQPARNSNGSAARLSSVPLWAEASYHTHPFGTKVPTTGASRAALQKNFICAAVAETSSHTPPWHQGAYDRCQQSCSPKKLPADLCSDARMQCQQPHIPPAPCAAHVGFKVSQ